MEYNFVLAIIIFLVYFRSIFYFYAVDDITRNKYFKTYKFKWSWKLKEMIVNIHQLLYGGGYLPLKIDHLVTLSLHITICIMIYNFFGRNEGSFLGALLYGINPVNSQTSIWLNGRRYAIVTIVALLIFKLKWGIILYPFFVGLQASLFPAIFLFKIHPISFIALIASGFGLYYLYSVFLSRKYFKCAEYSTFKPRNVVLSIKTISHYIQRCLFPDKMTFYCDFNQDYGASKKTNKKALSTDFEFFKGLVIIGILIFTSVYYKGSYVSIGILWFFLFISIWSNLITVTMLVADRYTSIANIGLMLALGNILTSLDYSYQLILITVFITYYLSITLRDMGMYKDIDCFFSHHKFYSPGNMQNSAFHHRAFVKQGDYLSAYIVLRRNILHNPESFVLLGYMVTLLCKMEWYDEASKYYDRMVKNSGDQTVYKEKELQDFIEGKYQLIRQGLEKAGVKVNHNTSRKEK